MNTRFNYLKFEIEDSTSSAYFETLARSFQKEFESELEYIKELKVIKVDSKNYQNLLELIIKDHPNFEAKIIDEFIFNSKVNSTQDYKYNDITIKLLKNKIIFESDVKGFLIESREYFEAKRILDSFFKKNIKVISSKNIGI